MCSSHAFEIRGLRVCLQFVCFLLMTRLVSAITIRQARIRGSGCTYTLNQKYQQKMPSTSHYLLTHLVGAKGGHHHFFSPWNYSPKSEWNARYCFFVWPSLWPAWFILCDLLQAQNVMPGLLSLRNFSFKAHYHTMLKNVYWFSRSGFQT